MREVDLKLIELGKQLDSVIVQTISIEQSIAIARRECLNINELANALKPVVLPARRCGSLSSRKERVQPGVAYLDDGTMVVVDNARKLIGKNADIAVTSCCRQPRAR